jgi:hypothetical protein
MFNSTTNTTPTPREPLPLEVVETARKSLYIGEEAATEILNMLYPDLLVDLKDAIEDAEKDLTLRAALNRILFSGRNKTFSYACREALDDYVYRIEQKYVDIIREERLAEAVEGAE